MRSIGSPSWLFSLGLGLLMLFESPLQNTAGDTVCRLPGGIRSEDPIENKELQELQQVSKAIVGQDVTDPSRIKIYVTTWGGRLFAACNYRPVCPPRYRETFKGLFDGTGRFRAPTKLLTTRDWQDPLRWTFDRIAKEFLAQDEARGRIRFVVDKKLVDHPRFDQLKGTGGRIYVVVNGRVGTLSDYELASLNAELKRRAKELGIADSAVFRGSPVRAKDNVYRLLGGIYSKDEFTHRQLRKLEHKSKAIVGDDVTDPSHIKIYVRDWGGYLFAACNYLPVCPPKDREKFRKLVAARFKRLLDDAGLKPHKDYDTLEELFCKRFDPLDDTGRFKTPPKLLATRDWRDPLRWTFDRIAEKFLISPAHVQNVRFVVDRNLANDPVFDRLKGTAARIGVIVDGRVWTMRAYEFVSQKPELTRWAETLRVTKFDELKRLRELLDDRDLALTAERLRVSTYRDLINLEAALGRFRTPFLLEASVSERTLELSDSKKETSTNVSDLLIRMRSGDGLPSEWKGQVVLLDVADLSTADTRRFAGKMLELVSEIGETESTESEAPLVVLTRDPGRTRRRLPRFINYQEVDFHNDQESLLKVERFGPLAVEILNGLVAGKSSGPKFHFFFGHLDDNASVIDKLITDAKNGEFRDTHLIVGVCNNGNWERYLELYEVAMANGAFSVTFPTRPINIPAMTLMALTLKKDPSLLRMKAPQTAVREAYRKAYRILSEGAREGLSTYSLRLRFGAKVPEFFRIDGKWHLPTVEKVLQALETDGLRMLTLADRYQFVSDKAAA